MSVIVILALVLTFVTLIIGPLLRSQGQAQAKTDNVQTAASALYRIERDLRNTENQSVYTCTTSPVACSQAPSSLTTGTNAIAFPTAYSLGTGQFQVFSSSAKPDWQGISVYWIDSNGDLNYAFNAPTGYNSGSLPSGTDVTNAVTNVVTSGGEEIGRNVQSLLAALPGVGHRVTLELQAQSTVNGSANETTYTTDLMVRNN